METWAAQYGRDQVQFLCVCVESKQTALMFHRMFEFQHAYNGYIPGRPYMPVGYGQLGCSGFVVVDRKGCFVSRQTLAYLDYGEAAFRNVEDLLAPMLTTTSSRNTLESSTTTLESESPKKKSKTNISKTSKIREIQVPSSVGVHSMDKEHEQCTTVLNALLQFPTAQNLKQVLEDLEAHFAHEEELLERSQDTTTDGGDDKDHGEFSALTSHKKDHTRILDLARNALKQHQQEVETGC